MSLALGGSVAVAKFEAVCLREGGSFSVHPTGLPPYAGPLKLLPGTCSDSCQGQRSPRLNGLCYVLLF